MIKNSLNNEKSKAGILLFNELTRYVTRDRPQVIIELDIGMGELSKVVLNRMHPHSSLNVFEEIYEKCEPLFSINDSRLSIGNIPAIKVPKIICCYGFIDCIISSASLISHTQETISEFINDCHSMLKKDGHMIQIFDANERKMLHLFCKLPRFSDHSKLEYYFPNSSTRSLGVLLFNAS